MDIWELRDPRRYEPEEEIKWKENAACKGKLDLFFPQRGQNHTVNRAKAICATCPVREECLSYALTNEDKHGVWGGKSERQRRAIRRRMRLETTSQKLQVL